MSILSLLAAAPDAGQVRMVRADGTAAAPAKRFSDAWWILRTAPLLGYLMPLPFETGRFIYTRESGVLVITEKGSAR